MSDQNNQIIDFEEIFKQDEIEVKNAEKFDNSKNKDKNVLTIILYVVLFFLGILPLFVQLLIVNINPKTTTYVALNNLVDLNSDDVLVLTSFRDFYAESSKIKLKDKSFKTYPVNEYNLVDFVLVSLSDQQTDIDFLNNGDNVSKIISGEINSWPGFTSRSLVVYYEDILEYSIQFDHLDNFYNSGSLTNFDNGLLQFLSYLLIFIPLVIINRREMELDFMYFKKEQHPITSKLLIGLAAMLAANFVFGIISQLLGYIFKVGGTSSNQLAIQGIMQSNGFIFMAISVVIFAPVVEELVFRKAIFGLIKSEKKAIIVSTITFGLLHVTTELFMLLSVSGFSFANFMNLIVISIPYLGMGAFLGYYYSKNLRNLSLLIGIHALSNLVSILIMFI